jgi:hypothetical protein
MSGTGEALLLPVRNHLSKSKFYNQDLGNELNKERVADGFVVAKIMKQT